jgi:hypothetical protein
LSPYYVARGIRIIMRVCVSPSRNLEIFNAPPWFII